jgi:Fic/DOC family
MAETWDANGTQQGRNLVRVARDLVRDALARKAPTRELARQWHINTMEGLTVPPPCTKEDIGRFRNEPGAEDRELYIGDEDEKHRDLPLPIEVGPMLEEFELRVKLDLEQLDRRYPTGTKLDHIGLANVIEVAARTHNEWVRIHPFANGNGRTGRMWVNFIFARYGLRPPFRIRPRPADRYAEAADAGMQYNDEPMRKVLLTLVIRSSLS